MAKVKAASRYRWVILAVTFLGQVANNSVAQIVAPLAPLIQAELGLSKAEVGMFSSAAFMGAWGVLFVAGTLTDRLGVRKMMSTGQMVVGTLLLVMATVGSYLQALAVLTIASLGRGAVNPPASKAITDWFPFHERATAMGLKQTGFPMGGILAAAVLPTVALSLGWRAAFVATGLFVLFSGTVTALLYRDVDRAGRMAASGVVSTRSTMGIVLRNRRLWAVSTVALAFVTVQIASTTYFALYLNDVVLVSSVPDERTRVVVAAGYLALAQIGGVVGRVFWGLVSDRLLHGRRMEVMVGIGVVETFLLVALVASFGPGYPAWALTTVLFAYGVTAIGFNGLIHTAVIESGGLKYAATSTGLAMTVTQFGTVSGPPLFGFVADVTGSYRPAWLFLGCLAAAGTALAAAIVKQERSAAQGS